MSNGAWGCARCGTRNLPTAVVCVACGRAWNAKAVARAVRVRSPGFAALLSGLLPGLGQIYQDRWVRGLLVLLLPVLALTLGGAFVAGADPLAALVLRYAPLTASIVIGAALALHLFVVADAFAGRLPGGGSLRGHIADYVVLGMVTLVLVGAYGAVFRQTVPWAVLAARIFAPIARQPAAIASVPEAPPPAWTGSDRLNVLVLGIDTRDGDRSTRNTDTMMVVSLDPLNRATSMLSIPRDLYIDHPGVFQGKINSAYAFGGPQLTRKLIDDLLGIRVNSYVIVNFEAFTKIVDGSGGVMIDARRPLRDELYPTAAYGVERVDILAGPQLMHGDLALRYARSRHDTNDYNRALRQQQVLSALRVKLAQPEFLRTLPALIDHIETTVETDFDPANVLPLARTASGIDSTNIRTDVMYPCGGDYPHCELVYSGDAGFYLFPDPAKVHDLAAQLFYDPRVRLEAAKVEVQSTGARSGSARNVAERLTERAFAVTGVTDGASGRSAILLRNSTKRYTAEQLRAELGGLAIESSTDLGAADIVVKIGTDFRGFTTDSAR